MRRSKKNCLKTIKRDKCLQMGCTWCAGNKKMARCRLNPYKLTCKNGETVRYDLLENEVEEDTLDNSSEKKTTTRKTQSFGAVIISSIYEYLFDTQGPFEYDNHLKIQTNFPTPICFDRGAFLFEDTNGDLFNLLAFGTGLSQQMGKKEEKNQSSPSDKLQANEIQSILSMPLTHIMMMLSDKMINSNKDSLLTQLKHMAKESQCDVIIIKFHNYGKDLVIQQSAVNPNQDSRKFLAVKQYERQIHPKVHIDCGNDVMSKQNKLNGNIKFYSYTIEFKDGNATKEKRRFTYVKFEEDSTYNLSHVKNNLEKQFFSPKIKTEDDISLLGERVEYRCEDIRPPPNDDEYGDWIEKFNPQEPPWYKSFRVGREFFVPQEETDIILNIINNNRSRISRTLQFTKQSGKGKIYRKTKTRKTKYARKTKYTRKHNQKRKT